MVSRGRLVVMVLIFPLAFNFREDFKIPKIKKFGSNKILNKVEGIVGITKKNENEVGITKKQKTKRRSITCMFKTIKD